VSRAAEFVDWDDGELEAVLNGPGGLVADLLTELSTRAALVATATVHVRPGTTRSTVWSPRSTARPPGFTKRRIRPHLGWGGETGGIFGGVNAPANPSILLEKPAVQIAVYEHKFPFLTTGLDSLEAAFR
jgi:hypothetical protein